MSHLWLGLLLSIPVGLGINLVSPLISGQLAQRTDKASKKRAASDAEFRDRAGGFARDTTAFYQFLLETLIRIAWIGALFGLVGGFFALLGQGTTSVINAYRVASGLFFASQLVALVGAIIVLNMSRDALVMIREVRQVRSNKSV